MNVMMLLEMAAQGFGDRVAFQNGRESLTYAELYRAAGAAATVIRESACEQVAVLGASSLATPVALFACAWAGVPYVPLNYRLADAEIDALLRRLAPVLLITDSQVTQAYCHLEGVEMLGREDLLLAARTAEPAANDWSMDPEGVAALLFTSGTTGAPKAAILRHRHLSSYILSSVEFMGAMENEAALVTVPPYHIAGISSVLSSCYAGRRVVQLPGFSAEAWLQLAANERISNAFVVPTMLARIVATMSATEDAESALSPAVTLPDLRAIAYGGGKMTLPVIEKAMSLFPNAGFTNAYGLTETSSTIAVLGPDDHRAAVASDDAAVRRRLVSVGRPLPGVEVEIRDAAGELLGPGVSGEIFVRGEQVSGEYMGSGSLLDVDGWFPTRDRGSLDAEGFLFLEGRADDVIVRGGENMSPGEIEDVLLSHDAVADVAVVGVPDEQWGEAIAAAVVLKSGEDPTVEALQNWVQERMRSSRVPQTICFYTELPYNETGKLLRRVVRDDLAGAQV